MRLTVWPLSWIVELETGDAFAGRGEGGFGELSELPAIDKRFEDILLGPSGGLQPDGQRWWRRTR